MTHTNNQKRILIDGRFIGVGESMTRYCLEIVKGILEADKENEYTLLIRPIGTRSLRDYFNDETRMTKSEQNINDQIQKSDTSIRHSSFGFPNLTLQVLDIPHYSLGEQTKLLKYLNTEKYDLVHFIQFNHPIAYRGKYVVTIHDLTLFGHLHRQKIHKKLAFSAVMKSAVRNSAQIITVSETTKKQLVELYHVPEHKIKVTYLGVDDKYCPKLKTQNQEINNFKAKYGIKGDYFLYTGMWKKHKNIVRMLKSFEQYLTEALKNRSTEEQKGVMESEAKQFNNLSLQLVLVGKIDKDEPEVIKEVERINASISNVKFQMADEIMNDKASPVRHSGLDPESIKLNASATGLRRAQSNRGVPQNAVRIKQFNNEAIVTTGFIDEAELPIAYAAALAYVIPSLSEGFGLPPLEAMACGTPVLSSNLSAMPEILGDAPLYFDPYDVEDMAEKMQLAASDGQLRANLSIKGLEQAKKYDWRDTANQTFKIYMDILE